MSISRHKGQWESQTRKLLNHYQTGRATGPAIQWDEYDERVIIDEVLEDTSGVFFTPPFAVHEPGAGVMTSSLALYRDQSAWGATLQSDPGRLYYKAVNLAGLSSPKNCLKMSAPDCDVYSVLYELPGFWMTSEPFSGVDRIMSASFPIESVQGLLGVYVTPRVSAVSWETVTGTLPGWMTANADAVPYVLPSYFVGSDPFPFTSGSYYSGPAFSCFAGWLADDLFSVPVLVDRRLPFSSFSRVDSSIKYGGSCPAFRGYNITAGVSGVTPAGGVLASAGTSGIVWANRSGVKTGYPVTIYAGNTSQLERHYEGMYTAQIGSYFYQTPGTCDSMSTTQDPLRPGEALGVGSWFDSSGNAGAYFVIDYRVDRIKLL